MLWIISIGLMIAGCLGGMVSFGAAMSDGPEPAWCGPVAVVAAIAIVVGLVTFADRIVVAIANARRKS